MLTEKNTNPAVLPSEYFSITDRVPCLIAIYSIRTGQYIYVNKAIKHILGYTPADFITGGLAFAWSLVHPDDIPAITEKNNRALAAANSEKRVGAYDETIVSFEYRMRHKNGSWRWLQTDGSVLSRAPDNAVEYLMNISIDITDRKEAEQHALQDLKRIKYALDQSAIVAITDKNGVIQYINKPFEEISQYSQEELIRKTHRIVNSKYHPKEFFAHMWKTILAGNVWQGEIRNQAKNGDYYWVDTTITPLLDEKGTPQQFIAIRHDITRRKELERQKDEFIGIASHELKTPVTSLKGYAQVMHTRFSKIGDDRSAHYMAKMDTQINKLTSLIQDLLDVTKIETGKLQFHREYFDMEEVVRECIDALQLTTETHAIELKGRVTQPVYGDRERIGQVITNFLSNAIKYSPNSDKITVRLSTDKRIVTVCVKDFGVGIDAEKQQRVFERFYRVSGAKEDTYPGLGLGLYISSELVKRHDGTIWVESKKGKGSSFCFSLPLDSKGLNHI